MHRLRLTFSLALCALGCLFLIATFTPAGGAIQGFASKLGAFKVADRDDDADADPDLPPGLSGKINKADYLRRRADNIDLLRGRPYNLPYDPRALAIEQMTEQEEALRSKAQLDGLNGGPPQPTWTPLGPAPIPNGQTSVTSVPVSGRTISIAVHPTDPNTVYVGAAQGGLKKSTDGGDTWTTLFDFQLESLAIGAITIDPIDTNIVYVGTGENGFSGDSFAGKGVYIIRNANSGTPTINGPFRMNGAAADVLSGRSIGRILVDPLDNNVIFVCTTSGVGGNPGARPNSPPARGIYRSTNAQSATPTFEKVTITGTGAEDRDVVDMAMDPGDPNVIIATLVGASSDGGIYRTANALAATPTWTRTRVLPDGATAGRAELAINRINTTVNVYAAVGEASSVALGGPACSASTRAGYVTKSTDGGVTWSTPLAGSTGFCGGQCFYDIGIAVTPDDQTVHLGGAARGGSGSCITDVMKRSLNGGAYTRNDTALHADEHVVAIAPSNSMVVYTGSDGGIWRSSDNGTTWVSKNTSTYSATQFQSLALHPFDRFFTIGGTQDNGTNCLAADGTTWTHCRDGDGGYTLIDSNAPDTTNVVMYHTFFNQTNNQIAFERATDTSFAWTLLGCSGTSSNNGIGCGDNVLFYAPMARGPGNPNTIYFGTDRLYRSVNRGDSMTLVSQGPLVAGQVMTTIGISPQDDNVRIVGLRDGSVFATTTGSSTMTNVTGANFPPPNPDDPTRKAIGRAVIDPNNKFTAYITFASFGLPAGQHVFKTTNLNNSTPTWTAAGNGIPDIPVSSFVVDPQNSNTLYAGTDIGVYQSTDGGANWAPFGTGLPRVAVFDEEINNVHRVLRIATHGRGLYEVPIGGTPLPILRAGTASLVGESCMPGNGVIDPGETVTVSFAVNNIGGGPTSNLMATLLSTGGVTNPSGAQSYGAVPASGSVSRNFTFTASGACASTITLTFQLTDGATNFGTVSVSFVLGEFVTGSPAFAENFDGVTAPALPAGWTTAQTGAATAWATTTTFADTAPNSAATTGVAAAGDNSLTSPTIAIPSAPSMGTNPGVQLNFRLNYNTEPGFDGAVLEIANPAVNGGAFQDILAAGGTFAAGGYNGTIGNTDSVLTGRQAWTGTSNGFITTTVNLPASVYGQNVQFRWRTAYDTGGNPGGGGTRIDTVSVYTATRLCCVSSPAPVSAVSRKNQGGVNHDIDLLSGSRIEPRMAGPGNSYQIVVTFPGAVSVGGVTVTSSDSMATAAQSVAGNVVTIDLMSVTDAQTLTVTLTGVSDGMNTHNVPVSITVLQGDVNEDSRVNVGDVNATKTHSGESTTDSNTRFDVNNDGRCNVGDVNFVKNHSGNAVTTAPAPVAKGEARK